MSTLFKREGSTWRGQIVNDYRERLAEIDAGLADGSILPLAAVTRAFVLGCELQRRIHDATEQHEPLDVDVARARMGGTNEG